MSGVPMGAHDEALADAIYRIAYAMLEDERWSDAADVLRAMMLACPRDERSWLALGRCHEALDQSDVALELYALGVLAVPTSVRCRLASARILKDRGLVSEADDALDAAEVAASTIDDDALSRLVQQERSAA